MPMCKFPTAAALSLALAIAATDLRAQFVRAGSLHLNTGYVGASSDPDAFGVMFRAHEWSSTASAEVRLGPGILVGPMIRHTFTSGSVAGPFDARAEYWSYGGHLGYVRDLGSGFTASAGVTFLRGDFCSCEAVDGVGYRRSGTSHLGGIARFGYALLDVLSVEAGVTLQRALGDVDGAYGYNFGFVGLALELPGYNRRVEEVPEP